MKHLSTNSENEEINKKYDLFKIHVHVYITVDVDLLLAN